MKKSLLFASLIALVGSISSCKKTYQCECVWESGSLAGQTQTLETAEKVSKKDAQAWCDENSAALGSGSCSLK